VQSPFHPQIYTVEFAESLLRGAEILSVKFSSKRNLQEEIKALELSVILNGIQIVLDHEVLPSLSLFCLVRLLIYEYYDPYVPQLTRFSRLSLRSGTTSRTSSS
jgi:hypothetical protein